MQLLKGISIILKRNQLNFKTLTKLFLICVVCSVLAPIFPPPYWQGDFSRANRSWDEAQCDLDSQCNRHERHSSLLWAVASSYRAVLPVADNLLQVGGRVKQEMVPPLIPVHSHGAVHINTARGRTEHTDSQTLFVSPTSNINLNEDTSSIK